MDLYDYAKYEEYAYLNFAKWIGTIDILYAIVQTTVYVMWKDYAYDDTENIFICVAAVLL